MSVLLWSGRGHAAERGDRFHCMPEVSGRLVAVCASFLGEKGIVVG